MKHPNAFTAALTIFFMLLGLHFVTGWPQSWLWVTVTLWVPVLLVTARHLAALISGLIYQLIVSVVMIRAARLVKKQMRGVSDRDSEQPDS